jgi:hypothetical protein
MQRRHDFGVVPLNRIHDSQDVFDVGSASLVDLAGMGFSGDLKGSG